MASRRYRDLFTTFSPLKNAFSLFLYELLILLLKKPRKPPTVLSSNLLLLGCPQQNLGGVHGRMEGRGQHFQRLVRARLHRTCLGYRVLLQPWVFEVCLTINIHRPWGCPCKHQQGQSPVLYCARAASGSLSIPPPSSRERWMGSKGDSPFPLVTVYLYFTLAAQASIS